MIIVGLTGAIGHGKTTFANLLDSQSRLARHFESWELVAEVANTLRAENPMHPASNNLTAVNHWLFPLADVVEECVHAHVDFNDVTITDAKLRDHPNYYDKLFEYLRLIESEPALSTVEITEETKYQFRPLLQWLGGFLVIIGGSGIWYDEVLRRTVHLQTSGCDLVTVGGVRYPGDAERLRNAGGVIIEIQRPNLPHQDVTDITERDRDLIKPDCVIINNGTLKDLQRCAQQVYADLARRQLAPTYDATRTPGTTRNQALQN